MKTGVIYCIENKVNGKKYIGKSTNYKRRWNDHKNLLNRNKHHNEYLQNSWNKHSEGKFKFKIIEKNISIKKLNEKEIYYISKFNTFRGEGYNLTAGGEGALGRNLTEEIKQKISNTLKGHKHSKETKEKISKSVTGFKHSKETINKMRKQRKGCKLSKETKVKISESKIGHEVSNLTKQKISKKLCPNLTKEKGIKIYKEYYENNIFQEELADKYNICITTINSIVNRKHWTTKDAKKMNKEVLKGEDHPLCKITKKQGLKILKEYKNTNKTYNDLAKKYNLGTTTINRIVKCKHGTTEHLKEGD